MISVEFSKLYQPVFNTSARYILIWGGRGRGGSHTSTNLYLHWITQPSYFRGYLMREVYSDIRESLWRDFKDRISENESVDEDDFALNESNMTAVYLPTGNTIMSKGFKKSSGNRTAKLKSIAGATHVIIEEADEIAEQDFKQLDDSLRTVKGDIKVILIFNPPPKNHWIWKRWFILQEDTRFPGFFTAIPKKDPSLLSIHSTYRENITNLNESFVSNLIDYQSTDLDYYGIMVEGLISEGAKGRIFRKWQPITDMPNAYGKFYGLDWGFNDPVALVECEVHNKTLWVKQIIYKTGLTNSELSKLMDDYKIPRTAQIYADSAEPKDIEDMKKLKWNIIPAIKGPDSVLNGIKYLKEFTVFVTEDSKDLWTETENYVWRLDQSKNPTNEPEDKFNHLIDAIRYAVATKLKKPKGISIV